MAANRAPDSAEHPSATVPTGAEIFADPAVVMLDGAVDTPIPKPNGSSDQGYKED